MTKKTPSLSRTARSTRHSYAVKAAAVQSPSISGAAAGEPVKMRVKRKRLPWRQRVIGTAAPWRRLMASFSASVFLAGAAFALSGAHLGPADWQYADGTCKEACAGYKPLPELGRSHTFIMDVIVPAPVDTSLMAAGLAGLLLLRFTRRREVRA